MKKESRFSLDLTRISGLAQDVLAGDESAKAQLTAAFEPLILESGNKLQKAIAASGLDPLDILQEGRIAAFKLTSRIDPNRIDKFHAFVRRRVGNAMIDFMRKNGAPVSRADWRGYRENEPEAVSRVTKSAPLRIGMETTDQKGDKMVFDPANETEVDPLNLIASTQLRTELERILPIAIPFQLHSAMLRQHLLLGRTHEQIADDFGSTLGSVETTISRLKERLRNSPEILELFGRKEPPSSGAVRGKMKNEGEPEKRLRQLLRSFPRSVTPRFQEKLAYLLRMGVPSDFFGNLDHVSRLTLERLKTRVPLFLRAGILHLLTRAHVHRYSDEEIKREIIPRLVKLRAAEAQNLTVFNAQKVELLLKHKVPENHHHLFFGIHPADFGEQRKRYSMFAGRGLMDFARPYHFSTQITPQELQKRILPGYKRMKRTGVTSPSLAEIIEYFNFDPLHPVAVAAKYNNRIALKWIKERWPLFRAAGVEHLAVGAYFSKVHTTAEVKSKIIPALVRRKKKFEETVGKANWPSLLEKIRYCRSIGAHHLANSPAIMNLLITVERLKDRMPLFVESGLVHLARAEYFTTRYDEQRIKKDVIPRLQKRQERALSQTKRATRHNKGLDKA